MKKKRMIMIVAMVLVLVWREDVFAVESGTTQVSLQADWLKREITSIAWKKDETVTLRNYIGSESVIVTPKEVGGKEVTRIGDSCFLRKIGSSGSADTKALLKSGNLPLRKMVSTVIQLLGLSAL